MEQSNMSGAFRQEQANFVIGTIKKPIEGNLLLAWQCNNDVITSWIINSISKEIAVSLVYTGNVKDLWDELKERYRQSNGPHVYQLRKDLVTTVQSTLSIEAYYAKFTTIWKALVEYCPIDECTCGGMKKMLEFLIVEFVMIFLMGLNDSFAQIRT
ncbi:uncharacterized protein LOC120083117 [Benincasa hispida]|uniref:uncharacterized protein LOC120083117 n=1 Tax=Benincasa hispida TaxID=102211 RepID=UPI0019007DE9|nr:uncharacterized protein LOC120083117 [Benincasa hispida]